MKQIVFNNVRVQLLSESVVRIEFAQGGKFCDGNTFFIPNKADYKNNEVTYTREEGVISFGEYKLYIPENAKSLTGVRLEKKREKD